MSNGPPLVSVIVPCFNEEEHIEKTLERLVHQDYTGTIEIIVVDDGSTDNTHRIVQRYYLSNDFPSNRRIIVLSKKNNGKPSALNVGIKKAHGKYCISTDGDTYLAKDAVRLVVERFLENERIGVVAGMVHVLNQNKLFLKLQEIEYVYGQLQFRFLQSEGGNVLIAPGCIFGIRTDLARKYPSSEETCVEDFDTTISVKTAGWEIIQEPRAKSFTHAPRTLKAWWNQRKRWWYGIFQVWRKHKANLVRFWWFLFFYPFGYLLGFINLAMWVLFPMYLMLSPSIVSSMLLYAVYFLIVIGITFFKLAVFLVDVGEPRLIAFLPMWLLYDFLSTFASAYLYIRYLLDLGISFRYGRKWVHAK